MKRLKNFHKISVVALLCFLFAFFVWDWTEKQINLHLSHLQKGLERIAQVQNANNNVARNHNGQLLWQDINAGEIIYLGNSVQTEKDSSTEIIFDDGEKIVIGPDSLVRFNRADDKISLQLVEGNIEVKGVDETLQEVMHLEETAPKRLMIKTPRGNLKVKNASLKIKADKNKKEDFKIEVVKGEPELVSTNNEKEVLPLYDLTPVKETTPPTTSVNEPALETAATEAAALPVETDNGTTITEATQEATLDTQEDLASEYTEVTPFSTQTLIDEVKTAEGTADTALETERLPAEAPLSAPKVKRIKVKEIE